MIDKLYKDVEAAEHKKAADKAQADKAKKAAPAGQAALAAA